MPADPITAMTERTSLRTSDSAQNCTSVDLNDIAGAAGLFTRRGFSLRQRGEERHTIERYECSSAGLQSDEDVSRVIERLEKSACTDTHVDKELLDR